MKDQVSQLLESREHAPLPWRWALAVALLLHVGVAAAVVMAPRGSRRALHLPSVQVRLAAPVAVARPRATPAPAQPAPAPPARRDVTARKPKPPQPQARKTTSRKVAPVATPAPTVVPAGGGGGAGVRSPLGSVGFGGGSTSADESFPYTYYLNRFLGMIESNWYRPPAPPGTHCRVLCRIDRSGRLAEAGIEEPSATPAFDRAALRAVYASAPFPPLPQGFGGSTLTMHLEFGP